MMISRIIIEVVVWVRKYFVVVLVDCGFFLLVRSGMIVKRFIFNFIYIRSKLELDIVIIGFMRIVK